MPDRDKSMPHVSNEHLQTQLAQLQGNMAELQDVMAGVQKQLLDNFNKASEAKHAVDGFQANFVGFKDAFREQDILLRKIHENLLASQYEKRITKLEAFQEQNQGLVKDLGMTYSKIAEVENNQEKAITAIKTQHEKDLSAVKVQAEKEFGVTKARLEKIELFQNSVETTVAIIKWVGAVQAAALIAGVVKLFVK